MPNNQSILVFYDGNCRLCIRSMKLLRFLDWLSNLQLINYHDESLRNTYASDLAFEDLDRAMHIQLPNGQRQKGYLAARRICWSLPLLWIVAPFMYLPGISQIGQKVYQRVAQKRHRCSIEGCGHKNIQ